MGWNSQAVIAQLVIIEGPGDALLVYNGTPAFGNLAASIAAQPGTDQYGNAYLDGFTSYAFGTLAQRSNAGLLDWLTAPSAAGPWTFASEIELSGQVGATAASNLRVNAIFGVNSLTYWLSPSGDTTGATDTAVISGALSSGASVRLVPGTFYLNAQVTVAGTTLAGSGFGTVIRPNTAGGAYTGPLLAAGAQGWITGLTVASSGSDAITVAAAVADWWLTDLNFASNAGWCINATITGPAHGRIRGIRGQGGGSSNGGGIALNGGTGAAITAEVNLYDVDVQNCKATEVLFLSAVTDVLVTKINGSIKSGVSANGITVQGACQTIELRELDVGGGSGTAVLVFQAAGGSPSDVFAEGKVQDGQTGVVVADGSSRLTLQLWADRNQGDGFKLTNTGAYNVLDKCGGNNNGLGLPGVGTAYDLDITSTGHWLVDSFRGVSGAVTANRNITSATNHVTVVTGTDPSGTTTAGNAPNGW